MSSLSAIARVGPGPALSPVPSEVVTTAEVKSFLRVTGNADDALIASLCTRARMIAERLTGRSIIKTSLYAFWDFVPGQGTPWWDGVRDGALSCLSAGYVELPRPPLISVEEVSGFNNDDSAVVMSASNYYVDTVDPDLPGRVALRLGAVWPIFTRTRNGFRVQYTAGYASVPEDLKHAILLMASWLFKNRGDCSDDGCAGGSGAMSFLHNFVFLRVS